MRVLVQTNRRDATRRLAFIRVETQSFGEISFPAYFAESFIPKADEEIEVMICGVLLLKTTCGNYYDFEKPPKCVFLRVIEQEDIEVDFNGFEILTSAGQTMSNAITKDGREFSISPGKLMPHLNVANNGDVGFDHPPIPLIPGKGWVRKNPINGMYRLEGVYSCHELAFVHKVIEKIST